MDQPVSNPNMAPPPENVATPAEATPIAPAEAPVNPETPAAAPERSPERGANINRQQPGSGPGVSLPPVQTPAVPPPATQTAQDDNQVDDNPLIADDVDVIEMEWVNKAKEIIKKTTGDPHAQEKAVEKLQIDYLKKRYGKEVKGSSGD